MKNGYSCSTCRLRSSCGKYRRYNKKLGVLRMIFKQIKRFKQKTLDGSTISVNTWKEFYDSRSEVDKKAFECRKCLKSKISRQEKGEKDLFFENIEVSNRDIPIIHYYKEWFLKVPKDWCML